MPIGVFVHISNNNTVQCVKTSLHLSLKYVKHDLQYLFRFVKADLHFMGANIRKVLEISSDSPNFFKNLIDSVDLKESRPMLLSGIRFTSVLCLRTLLRHSRCTDNPCLDLGRECNL